MKKFNESLNQIKKVSPITIKYWDLFPMLNGLEPERKGIKDRVWNFLKDELDIQFKPIKNRTLGMNLYYYGIGEEYPIKGNDKSEFEHSRKIHPEAFIDGSKEKELRLDFNLIWSTYQDEINDPEMFYIMPNW